jgi:hypothetical protein
MTNTHRPRRARRLARATAAVAAVASLGGLAAGTTAAAESSSSTERSSIFCWKEYDFTRSGNALTATAIKDCTHLEVPQLLPVSIQGFFTDEGGPSGWFTVKSGIGVAKTTCIPGWPMWYRHSATLEIIYC